MSIRVVLGTSTAVALLLGTGAAFADGNILYLSEPGSNNTALVQQGQTASNGNNQAGTAAQPITQNGTFNDATITQTYGSTLGLVTPTFSSNSQAGYEPDGGVSDYATGVDQNGNHNVLNDIQVRGTVARVLQTSVGSTGSTKNTLNINQSAGVANGATVIGSVEQNYDDATGAGPGNIATLNQTSNTDNHRDLIQKVYQKGTDNQLTATQSTSFQTIIELQQQGSGNRGTVSQSGSGNWLGALYQNGSSNQATVNFTGNNNGGNSFNSTSIPYDSVPVGALGTWNYASNSGAYANQFRQMGISNQIGALISGNSNYVGINQFLTGNQATGIVVSGNHNSLGIYQNNLDNVVSLASIVGNYNDIGIRQDGQYNLASVDSTASDSRIWIKEVGNNNNVAAIQSGTWGLIQADVNGSRNHLKIRQANSGSTPSAGNSAVIAITGSDNNNYPTSSALSGDSLSAFLVGYGHDSTFADQGDLYQAGSSNSMNVSVSTDLNAFAMLQDGSGNSITHTVTTGNANYAGIVQIGMNNTSVTTQAGGGNNIGVVQ